MSCLQFSAIFANISAKTLAFFSKSNVMIEFLKKLTVVKCQYLGQFFRRKYFLNRPQVSPVEADLVQRLARLRQGQLPGTDLTKLHFGRKFLENFYSLFLYKFQAKSNV
jgi:hypothetical protein